MLIFRGVSFSIITHLTPTQTIFSVFVVCSCLKQKKPLQIQLTRAPFPNPTTKKHLTRRFNSWSFYPQPLEMVTLINTIQKKGAQSQNCQTGIGNMYFTKAKNPLSSSFWAHEFHLFKSSSGIFSHVPWRFLWENTPTTPSGKTTTGTLETLQFPWDISIKAWQLMKDYWSEETLIGWLLRGSGYLVTG